MIERDLPNDTAYNISLRHYVIQASLMSYHDPMMKVLNNEEAKTMKRPNKGNLSDVPQILH